MHKNLLPDELRDRALDEYNKAIAKGELDRHEKSAVVFFGENPNECKVVSDSIIERAGGIGPFGREMDQRASLVSTVDYVVMADQDRWNDYTGDPDYYVDSGFDQGDRCIQQTGIEQFRFSLLRVADKTVVTPADVTIVALADRFASMLLREDPDFF